MDWEVKKRGRVTYYKKKTNQLFSDLVVEELDNGDLKIRFVGMTGALAATNELELDDVARMDPQREIPRVFDTWDMYVREAGLCDSLADLDFLEIHSFGAAPKEPSPISDPAGFAEEKKRLRQAYSPFLLGRNPFAEVVRKYTSVCSLSLGSLTLHHKGR